MNRRERRAQWLTHHRGEASARGDAGASSTLRREPRAADREARHTHDRRAARIESNTALRLASPVAGSLRLHIEEVVLHGFNPRGRYAVGDAIQHELTRLLTERGLPTSLIAPRASEQLDAGAFHTAPNSRPHALGAQVARAVYGGLKR